MVNTYLEHTQNIQQMCSNHELGTELLGTLEDGTKVYKCSSIKQHYSNVKGYCNNCRIQSISLEKIAKKDP